MPVLLCLPLLVGLVNGAAAQTIDSTWIVEGETKIFTVSGIPTSWTGTGQLDITFPNSGTTQVTGNCGLVSLVPGWDLCLSTENDTWDPMTRVATFQLQANADMVSDDRETLVVRYSDPDDSNRMADFTITILESPPPPPPIVSVHPKDAVGVEGANNSASVELRLSRALESGEELTVPYSLDLNATASASQTGVTIENPVSGNPSTGTLKIAGPNAPQSIVIELRPAANSVDSSVSGVRAAEFRLTNVSGVSGAEAVAGADSTKVFVNDGSSRRHTYMNVSGGSTNATTTRVVDGATIVRLDGSIVDEGGKVLVLLDGKAGRKRNAGRPYEPHNVTVGVQHLTTDFDDLGAAYAGHDAFVGRPRRDESAKTDYYNVGVLGMGFTAEMWIPANADAAGEGDERFRVFIAGTPDYMGVEGAYNATDDRAPGVDFTIRGQPGGGQRDGPPRAEPAPVPTEAVSNVRVAAVDAATAEVTWDAVERAAGYEVEYETTSVLVDEDNHVQGAAFGLTDTSFTFRHGAAEAMTLTVTVTPVHEDEDGGTQALAELAGTATIDVGPAGTGGGDSVGDGGTGGGDSGTGDPPPPASCVSDEQWSTVAGYYDSNANKSPNYGANWYRVLIAYRLARPDLALPDWEGATAEPTQPYTVKEAEDGEAVWSGWTPVRKALQCLQPTQTPAPQPDPAPDPELSLSAGPAVDEGAGAAFTVHADPAPRSDLTVSVTVAQAGDYLDSPGAGARTLTLPAGASSAGLAVATVDDGVNEADGSVSAALNAGTGYRVSSSNNTAAVAVRDDDEPPAAKSCVDDGDWRTVKGYYASNAGKSPNYGANWYRVLIAYRLEDADRALPDWTGATERPTTAYTVREAEDGEKAWSGWTPVRKVLECLRDANLVSRSFAPLVPAASNPAREGVVRIANPGTRPAAVRIAATDDAGWRPAPLTLRVGPGASVELTSRDLERGSPAKGLAGYLGAGTGDWRLDVSGDSAVEVRPHVRSADGRLAAMGAVAPVRDGAHQVAVLHPADHAGQTGLLRLVNRGSGTLAVRITATDDAGAPSGGAVSLQLPARAAATFTAAELERGGAGLDGALGDGDGLWRLRVASNGDLAVVSLAEDAGGHLANLSDPAPAARLESGVHAVAGFPSAYGPAGRPGTLRIVNDSAAGGTVTIRPHDAQGRALGAMRLRLEAGGAANLDAWDLEFGNPAKGLSGSAGPGPGDWRIEMESDLDLRVLPLIETRLDHLGESQNPRR